MLKKIILILAGSIFVLTGCQTVNNVDLNKMVTNSSQVKSSEGKVTTSLDFTYNKAEVSDPDLLKVLDLFNHAKIEIQANMQDKNTESLSGTLTLQKGKIPFQLYVDQQEMVLLVDHAKKPIRVAVDQGDSTNTQLVQDLQIKLLEPIVKNFPNPDHITVGSKTEKVNDTDVSGYNVHAEVYANEVPKLLTTFFDNLIKDQAAVSQIVNVINELNQTTGGTTVTVADFNDGLKELVTELNLAAPELQDTNVLNSKNYFKTDIFLDKDLNQRKVSADLNIASIPTDLGLGISGIRLRSDSEIWNIDGQVKAGKISYSSYLNEDVTADQFLATLDKRSSVLYSVIEALAYEPSNPLKASQVSIQNNPNKADTITVKGLVKGDVVKVYKEKTGGDLWATIQATGSTATIPVKQLGKNGGNVYVSIISANKTESSRLVVGFKSEICSLYQKNQKIFWDGMELKKGQIGSITVLQNTSLYKLNGTKKSFARTLKKGEFYRIYAFKPGMLSVGGGYYIDRDSKIKYKTPSNVKLTAVKCIASFK